jgi:integrase
MPAYLTSHVRATDGVTSYYVRWREGGIKRTQLQTETFSRYSSGRNKQRAEKFKRLVDDAGQHWPEGHRKGDSDRDPRPDDLDAVVAVPTFAEAAKAYAELRLGITPGTRRTYLRYARILPTITVQGPSGPYQPFAQRINQITKDDVARWRLQWMVDGHLASVKSQSNYHGFVSAVFHDALERGYITRHPALKTGPSRKEVRAGRGKKRALLEVEFNAALDLIAKPLHYEARDLLQTIGSTGMRWGEVTAMWVGDVDLDAALLTVSKGWKGEGEDGEQDVPDWLRELLKPKHTMRQCYLGGPKSLSSAREVTIDSELVEILRPHVEGRAPDDFLFLGPGGLPIHGDEFRKAVMWPLKAACRDAGTTPFDPHELRHSHIAWLMAAGIAPESIAKRVGHEGTEMIEGPYFHELPQVVDHINETMLAVRRGAQIRHAKRAPLELVPPLARASAS